MSNVDQSQTFPEMVRVEARASTSDDRSPLILDSVRDYAIFMLSPTGIVETWNPGAERLKGYKADEIIGQHFSRFYLPEEVARGKCDYELKVAAAEGSFEDESWRVRKDGSLFWANAVISAIRGRNHQLLGFAKVTRDMTQRRNAEEKLRHSEERFRLLVSSVKDYAIFMLSPEGLVETWNTGAERLKGYLAQEIVGQPFSRFYTPEDVAQGRPWHLLQVAVQEGRVEDEGWRVRKDGTRFWADVVITAVLDGEGTLRGFAKVTRDLSHRRAAEQSLRESEQRFRLLVDSVKDYSIFMLDPEGRVTTWNSGAERIKGYSREEIIGQHFSRFYAPEDLGSGKAEHELQTAASEGRFEDEGWRVRKDGTRFWANVVLTAIRNESGELLGFAKVTRDLTDRKRAEEARIRLAQAHEAVRLRDEFLAVASHEFKTPLQSLKLQLELVKRALGTLDAFTLNRLAPKIETMQRQVERLGILSNGLLDLSTMRSGKLPLQLECLELASAVRSSIERVSIELAHARCEVRLDLEPGVSALLDASRFDQILVNLLSNAAKYGAGRPVEVTVRAEEGFVTVTVTDRGIGISPEDLSRIFEKFERAVSAENYGGLGLGLFIARQLVETMEGTIEANSTVGQGSTFKVRFKRAPSLPAGMKQ